MAPSINDGTGPIYKCGRCGGTFSSAEACNEHRQNCDGGNDPNGGSGDDPNTDHTCGVCGQVFSSSTALGAHALRCHRDAADGENG